MGKIPEYNRNKFVSSYVGAPVVDKSGEIIASSISKAGNKIIDIQAQKLQQQTDRLVDAQAEKALLDYSLAYQRQVKDLETEYAGNPQGLPEAVSELGQKLQTEYTKNIPDERVSARFGGAANSVISRMSTAALSWSTTKQKENAEIAATDVVRTSALMVGQTTDFNDFSVNLKATENKLKGMSDVTQKQINKMMPDMVESHLYMRARQDPDTLKQDILGGMYDKVKYFDADMKKKFLDNIDTRKRQQNQELRVEQRNNYAMLADEVLDESLPFESMFARIDEVRNSLPDQGGLRQEDYTRLKKTLFTKINSELKDMQSDTTKADKYVAAIKELSSDRVDKMKRSAVLLDMYQNGFSKQEIKELNSLYGINSAKDKFFAYTQHLGNFVGAIYPTDPLSQAKYLRKYVSEVMTKKNPQEALTKISNEAARDKVVRDDPSLAYTENPVEEAYRKRAITILKRDGQPVRPENIQWAIEQLKQMERANIGG